ncbi:signal peptidase I [Haloferax namakaokahaiae]|uniref:Signal peptidase I n=1 Tax=Haloferax namakaokahaiae TaxID=1748331 RepID=A0ABD5ZCD1_9EURY
MKVSKLATYVVVVLLLGAVVALLFGYALGQPVLFGYVETGSMSPTMEPGDGFVAVPSVLTDSPEAGDIVVFRAENLHGGGLTTHRVVRETPAGYITRGDANPFTDQDNVEPPVSESRIVAEALEVGGGVVVIPGLGGGVQALTGVFSGILGGFAALFGVDAAAGGAFSPMVLVGIGGGLIALSVALDVLGGSREPATRSRRRPNYLSAGFVLFVLVLLVTVPATASMVFGSGTTSLDIVSSQSPNESPLVVGAGETTTVEYRLTNRGFVPTMVLVESTHPDVSFGQSVFLISGQANATTTLTIRAPEETGAYTREISEQRYVPLLPQSVITALHDVHPYVAIAAIDAVLVLGALVLGVFTLGMTPIRMRSVGRDISLAEEIKRRFL